MSEEKAIVEKKADLPAEYGSREELLAASNLIRTVMPGGEKLSPNGALATAEVAHLFDANFMTGDIYAYEDKSGKLVLVLGYKLLVRWAEEQGGYLDRVEKLTDEERADHGLEAGDIAYRVKLMRLDRVELLPILAKASGSYDRAWEDIGKSAIGIVRASEMWSTKYNKAIEPPVGWTWDEVAEKRARKTAILKAFKTPSPKEMLALGRRLLKEETGTDKIELRFLDEAEAELPDGTNGEKVRLAAMMQEQEAHDAEWKELTREQHQEKLQENVKALRGDADFDGFDPELIPPPEYDEEPEPPPPRPPAQPTGKKARVECTSWGPAARELVVVTGYYKNPDGKPNWPHLLNTAGKYGFAAITDDNLNTVIDVLRSHADEKRKKAAEAAEAQPGLPGVEG